MDNWTLVALTAASPKGLMVLRKDLMARWSEILLNASSDTAFEGGLPVHKPRLDSGGARQFVKAIPFL